MRILHVTAVMASSYGGPKVVIETLARAQVAAGHDVTVVTTDCGYPSGRLSPEERRRLQAGGVDYRMFRGQGKLLHFSAGMWRWLGERVPDYDVVHTHGLYRFPQSVAALIARRKRVPHVITPHGALDPFLHRKSRHSVAGKRCYELLIEDRLLRSASAVHFAEDEEARIAVLPNGLQRIAVIPNGLDVETFLHLPDRGRFRSGQFRHEDYIITFYGRINFVKGLDLLIPAFALVQSRHPHARLLLVGPDNECYMKSVRKWIDEKGIADSVHYLGEVSRVEGIGILRDSDLFVLPSYTENFGMTVLEALLCECPVVISKAVKVKDRLLSIDAAVVTGLSVESVAEGMLRIIDDRRYGEASARRGRDYVQNALSIDRVAQQMVELYGSLV